MALAETRGRLSAVSHGKSSSSSDLRGSIKAPTSLLRLRRFCKLRRGRRGGVLNRQEEVATVLPVLGRKVITLICGSGTTNASVVVVTVHKEMHKMARLAIRDTILKIPVPVYLFPRRAKNASVSHIAVPTLVEERRKNHWDKAAFLTRSE